MLPSYETERLILHPRTLNDLEDCLAMDLDPKVVQYIRPTEDEETHRAFLKERLAVRYETGLGFWSVFLKNDKGHKGSFLGWVLLVPLAGQGPEIEIGYRFLQKAWGKGFASEAARSIRDHAFTQLDLEQIVAVTHPDNKGSQNVLKKLGLQQGQDRFAYDQILPFFALSREDWKRLKSNSDSADKPKPAQAANCQPPNC
ncbi:MAG: GNAT family N-acetyltransferase [Cohaesibacter sp.]|nr:GNAT family N-acetyltransferase [Cohaesibacter sp.]